MSLKQKVFLNEDVLKEQVNSINLSPNNKDLIFVSRSTINILDMQTKKLTRLYSEGGSFNRNNEHVVVIFSSCGQLIEAKGLVIDDVELLIRHGACIKEDNSRQLLFLASKNQNIDVLPEEHQDSDALSVNNINSLKLSIN